MKKLIGLAMLASFSLQSGYSFALGEECEHAAKQYAVTKYRMKKPEVTHVSGHQGSDGWDYIVAPLVLMDEAAPQKPIVIFCAPPVDPEIGTCSCE